MAGNIVKSIIILILVLITVLIIYQLFLKPKEILVIFCSGSLYYPLTNLCNEYCKLHSNINIIVEPSGSVIAMKKVTELGKRCDILAVADYKLITNYTMPRFSNFCIIFATNEIVLCYTNQSKYYNIINKDNWYNVLMKDDVTFGFSNPNNDPADYRTLITMLLASLYYNNSIFHNLVEKNSNISYKILDNKKYVIEIPLNIIINTDKIKLRSKSVDLISLLKEGSLDYAFEYKSVAIVSGLDYVELPMEINLGSPKFLNNYQRISVILLNGTDNSKKIDGELILYGITIPTTVGNLKDAIDFINFMFNSRGRIVLERGGLKVLNRPLIYGKPPEGLKIGGRDG